MDSRVMACGVQADAVHAVDKVTVWRVDGRWGSCVRGRVACMADHMRQVRVTRYRWTNEKVERVSVAEYTSRMDTEPLGALGMDLGHSYDGVKIRVNVHTRHFTRTL